ncbi:MAG: PsiF family protein [Gallionella sp.]
MKRTMLILPLLFLACSAQAAQDGQSCENRSLQMKPEARQAFLTSCLAQASAPANVQAATHESKQKICTQNEKNLKKEGVNKPGYMNECMTKNEAAVAAQKVASSPATAPVVHHAAKPASKAAVNSSVATPAKTSNSKKSCAKQAHKKHLKGDERKKFIANCTQA